MKTFRIWRTLCALVVVTGLGAAALFSSNKLSRWESPQVIAYNDGVAALKDGFNAAKEGKEDEAKAAFDKAMVAFDTSLDAYASMEQRDSKEALLYPSRSTELAALAQSKKALLYIVKQKPELAVKAFKDSIMLNPGSDDVQILDQLMKGETLSQKDIARLTEQSAVVKHNLELLFKKNKSMADGEGKGKGKPKPGDKDGKPGDQPAPGTKPGPGSGKGNPNAI